MLSITALLLLQWYDPRLTWDNKNYSCDVLNIPVNSMWYPPLTLLNSASSSQTSITPGSQTTANVFFNGKVNLWIVKQFDSTCTLDLQDFPYDSQNCEMWLISMDTNTTHAGTNLTVQDNDFPFFLYSQTGEFDLNSYDLYSDNSSCFVEECFSSLFVNFYYTRRSSYYVMTVIVPLFILTGKQ